MTSRYRWFVVAVFFAFMLLHQADKLIIGPLNTRIMETFGINEQQMGAVGTGALVVGAVAYPLWGYLYDRFARAKLLALASFLWGSTTWLGAIAPTFGTFLAARSSTGIDDSSYPGLYSLISDYFPPKMRGRVYGTLQVATPLGYMLGLILATFLGGALGWRNVFYITGGLGIVVGLFIFFGVRDMPRGKAEPELEGFSEIITYKFKMSEALGLLRKPTLIPLFVQGFFGVFPLQVISFWFFNYMETERLYDQGTIFAIMAIAVLLMGAGAFIGGTLGDRLFKRTLRGRLTMSTIGVFTAMTFLFLALNTPNENIIVFAVMLFGAGLFTLFSGPNVIATVYDITVPEVRSTALSVQYFIESIGSAFAPLAVGTLAVQPGNTLSSAILTVCISTYLICAIFLIFATFFVPRDIKILRAQMRERADENREIAVQNA